MKTNSFALTLAAVAVLAWTVPTVARAQSPDGLSWGAGSPTTDPPAVSGRMRSASFPPGTWNVRPPDSGPVQWSYVPSENGDRPALVAWLQDDAPADPDEDSASDGTELRITDDNAGTVDASPEYVDALPQSDVLSWFAPGRGRFFAGAEYIWARPHFSQGWAMTRISEGVPSPNNNNQILVPNQDIFYNYTYDSDFRVYAGYRLDSVGSEVRFTYTWLRAESSVVGTPGPNQFGDPSDVRAWDLIAGDPGESLVAQNRVRVETYDIEFSRSIQTGGAWSDGASYDRWDLRWSAGVRIASLGYDSTIAVNPRPTFLPAQVDISADFVGAGPIVGLEGRRYLGQTQQFSVYANWDLSLLVGQYEHQWARTTDTPPDVLIESLSASTTRAVPVTEIELGVSWKPQFTAALLHGGDKGWYDPCYDPPWTISLGWFFQAWWDAGMAEVDEQACDLPVSRKDANIQSWDGLTLRFEYVH